jgi:hypothetical protein
MDFFFFVPNLIVAEIIIRAPKFRAPIVLRVIAVAGLTISSTVLVFSTYYFTRLHWGADILARLHGL